MLRDSLTPVTPPAAGVDYRQLKVFADVQIEPFAPLLAACPVRELRKGEVLIRRGEHNHALYAVVSGRLCVEPDSLGREPAILLGAGDTVLEPSLVDRRPSPAQVTAASPARVLVIEHRVFWALLSASHAFAANVLALLGERLRYARGRDTAPRLAG